MPIELTPTDEICRCIIFDRAFQGSIHIDQLLWIFGKSDDEGYSHESAILRRLAINDNEVHQIGCSIAAIQNLKRGSPEPGPKRRYYCGFRSAKLSELPMRGDGFVVSISHAPEGDIEAHLDVALQVEGATKNARANNRTDAGLALAESFGPPVPHLCECDRGDDQHPFVLYGEECLTAGLRDRWPDLSLSVVEMIATEDANGLAQAACALPGAKTMFGGNE